MDIRKFIIFLTILLLGWQPAFPMQTQTVYQQEEIKFINKMVEQYGFSRDEMYYLIYNVHFLPEVIWHMQKPYERKPWYIYKNHFLKPNRISGGIAYQQEHEKAFARAEKEYGVPADIITAIVGIESFYGHDKGVYPVLNSLATLAFAYPRRSEFFTNELAQYLLLARELHYNPRKMYGSYAGAIGLPQFMPSSYRLFAVDFNDSHKRDLLDDSDDVIGSVANYFVQFGWQRGQPIAVPAEVKGEKYKKILNNTLEPIFTVEKLKQYGITPMQPLPPKTKVNLIKLQDEDSFEYWLGLNNFYVITQYNTSIHYAMAVFQLAMAIEAAKQEQSAVAYE